MEERRVMADFARFTEVAVHVDDFPQDFNAAADVGRRQQALTERRLAQV
jgi:acyl-CoA dehydrogenase